MMNCENCGNELVKGAIICRACKHNNALRRVGEWRARRTGDLAEPTAVRAASESPTTTSTTTERRVSTLSAVSRPQAKTADSKPLLPRQATPQPALARVEDATPIRTTMPSAAPLAAVVEEIDDESVAQYPPWRAQLKEKVRQAREKRQPETGLKKSDPDEAQLDPNPLVEAALKRIRHTAPTSKSSTQPRIVRHGAQAAALATEFDAEPETEPTPRITRTESKPAPPTETRITPRIPPITGNPLMARREPVAQPGSAPAEPPKAATTRAETKTLTPRATNPVPPSQTVQQAATEPAPKAEIPTARPATIPPMKMSERPATTTTRPAPQTRPQPKAQTKPVLPSYADADQFPITDPASTPIALPIGENRKNIETQIIDLTGTGKAPAAPTETDAQSPNASAVRQAQAATLWVRTLAGACDFEIIATAYLPMFASYATLDTSLGRESLAIMLLLLTTIVFCYQLLTLTLADRTFGMALLNLQLVNTNAEDQPLTLNQKLLRALGATIAFMCPPLNLVLSLLHKEQRSLPDRLSGTVAVEL